MTSVPLWIDEIPNRNGGKSTVNALTFKPDGLQLVAAVNSRVLIYDTTNGTLLNSLKAHKDIVYSVDYSHNGKRFASGGSDHTVIIWTHKAEGILKYSHNDSIQIVLYNPISHILASCTNNDFGLWSPEQKAVSKYKIISKILTASWTNDGQYLTIGMLNGHISIRDKEGIEKILIEKKAPIWSICWNPSRTEPVELLAVACWDKTLSFYQLNGTQHGKDRKLSFNPCCISYIENGQYLLVSGSNCKASMYTKDGTKLLDICQAPGWIWTCKSRPKHQAIAVGCDDGTISLHKLTFGTVHGIYQERYAYRENMTDVIVQHLMTEQKVRIKTRDFVRKIAVYRDRLAVQLSDRIIIYELSQGNSVDMHYRVRERILKQLDCNLLVVTSINFVLCLENQLQQYDFAGNKEREWILESPIRYIKVIGGERGREGLLVGLKNGSVQQVFLNNPFPVELIHQKNSVRCLDISADRKKLAVVDESSTCLIYDLVSKEMIFEENEANSVAWNSECNDMLCFSGKSKLKIKTGPYPVHTQRMNGFCVGFTGSKVFCLNNQVVQTVDVPQSSPLYRYIDEKKLDIAYTVACLGVTPSDWRLLAMAALKAMNFQVARQAFIRLRDMQYIELINHFEQNRTNEENVLAEVYAYESKFSEAAKVYAKAGKPDLALTMYTDMRMWDEAKAFASENGTLNIGDLVKKQAEWAEGVHDWRAAAEMHAATGNFIKAVQIIGDQHWYDELADIARKLDGQKEVKALNLCAKYLSEAKEYRLCRDVYLKIGNIEGLINLHVQLEEWQEAIRLAKENQGEYSKSVYLPYAKWLTDRDRFDDALEAFQDAGVPKQCIKLLEELTYNAIVEKRFKDASYYHFKLAEESMHIVTNHPKELTLEDKKYLRAAREHCRFCELYYAYSFVDSFTDDPFTHNTPETLFHAARFIINVVGKEEAPIGISKVSTFYTLGQQAIEWGAFKLARYAFDKLIQLSVPRQWQDQIDMAIMTLQTKPFTDREDLLPIDYRSSSTNPLINTTGTGDVCVNSRHPFQRSFVTFENLPLVEFQPAEGISDAEAVRLLSKSSSSSDGNKQTQKSDGWKETDHGDGVQTMAFDDDVIDEDALFNGDSGKSNMGLFEQQLSRQSNTSSAGKYVILKLDAKTLSSLSCKEVFIQRFPCRALRNKYYKNMIPEIQIKMCPSCRKFFHEDDYDFELLKNNGCPVCHFNPGQENNPIEEP